MLWFARYLTYAPARQLIRDCAAYTIAEYGAGSATKLRSEIETGTPLTGRLLMWIIIWEVRTQTRLDHRKAAQRRDVS